MAVIYLCKTERISKGRESSKESSIVTMYGKFQIFQQ